MVLFVQDPRNNVFFGVHCDFKSPFFWSKRILFKTKWMSTKVLMHYLGGEKGKKLCAKIFKIVRLSGLGTNGEIHLSHGTAKISP